MIVSVLSDYCWSIDKPHTITYLAAIYNFQSKAIQTIVLLQQNKLDGALRFALTYTLCFKYHAFI